MSDPRETPGYKQKRNDEKVVMLLSAILDALLKTQPPARKAAKSE
jgi:hypothetical protein